jgi:hypothetical protein
MQGAGCRKRIRIDDPEFQEHLAGRRLPRDPEDHDAGGRQHQREKTHRPDREHGPIRLQIEVALKRSK